MIFYWVLFFAAAAPAFVESRQNHAPFDHRPALVGALLFGLLLAVAIGFRDRVGGDWDTYLEHLDRVAFASFGDVLVGADPGYQLLNWFSNQVGWGIVGVNLIGGLIFTFGLVRFCRSLPKFWLALAVAVPYLVIVVGMGYFRQGIALGLVMVAMVALRQRKLLPFLFFVLLGATFHKTAIIMLLGALVLRFKNRLVQVGLVGVALFVGYDALLADSFDKLYNAYIEQDYQSQGALVRLLMNAAPAAILLVFNRRFPTKHADRNVWRAMAAAALILLAAYFVFPTSSTAIDRLALYIIPLQLYVFSHLPAAFAPDSPRQQSHWLVLILCYYAATLAVWLVYANHSQYWLPYRSFLLA